MMYMSRKRKQKIKRAVAIVLLVIMLLSQVAVVAAENIWADRAVRTEQAS